MRGSQRHAEQRIGAKSGFVFSAVEIDQALVQTGLVEHVKAVQCFGDFAVDVLNGFFHAFTLVTGLVAVTQLDGFLGSGGCARGNGSAADLSAAQRHFRFKGRIAAAVEDFAGDDVADLAHGGSSVNECRG